MILKPKVHQLWLRPSAGILGRAEMEGSRSLEAQSFKVFFAVGRWEVEVWSWQTH